VELLAQERICPKTCATFADGLAACERFQPIDMIVAEYQLADGTAATFLVELKRRRRKVPFVVMGAPLKAEASLYQGGALLVLNPGFSPRSAALQCANLTALIKGKRSSRNARVAKQPKDFIFGTAVVSKAHQCLKSKYRGRRQVQVPLSRLQVRFLEELAKSDGQLIDYESLFHLVWDRGYSGDNGAVRECASSLRQCFKKAGFVFNHFVTTIHGSGYRYGPQTSHIPP